MKTVTVADFADSVKIPVDKLMHQLADAGVAAESPDSEITSEQKTQLLLFLRKAHGAGADAEVAKPARVTLRRNVTSELPQGSGPAGRSRLGASRGAEKVTVTVRKKRTFVKKEAVEAPEPAELDAKPDRSVELPAEEASAEQPTAEQAGQVAAEVEAGGDVDAVEAAADSVDSGEVEGVEAVQQPQGESATTQEPEAAPESDKDTVTDQSAVDEAKTPAQQVSPPAVGDPVAAPPAKPSGKDNDRGGRKKKHGEKGERRKAEKPAVLGGLASKRRRAKVQKKSPQQTQHGFEMPTGQQVKEIAIGETITLAELANKLSIKAAEVIKAAMQMGQMVTINQVIDQDTAILLTEELGHKAQVADSDSPEGQLAGEYGESAPRAPVVTVMGHVDHGKTTLLDYIRNSKVAAGESGGITQHIGAYHVETDKGAITFLDTPGHAAFSAMRARGARLTDMIVLVVAADDGVMPQTLEVIKLAAETEVPLVVAVNKMDKPEADANRVKQELSSHGVAPDDWGGESQFVEISAKSGEGVDDLLDALLLQAELLELAAPQEGAGCGVVIESKLDRGRGPVATVLIQKGTLEQGNIILAGTEFGRARVLTNEYGKNVDKVGPSLPIEIVGLSGAPAVGDDFNVVGDEKKAREVAEFRRAQLRDKALASRTAGEEDIFSQLKASEISKLNVIIKADVHGSSEALVGALLELPSDEVAVNVVHSGVGAITETDVNRAISSGAMIIGFNVRADATARKLAQDSAIDLRYHSVIYEAIDDITQALTGMLKPEYAQQIIGLAEVREVFRSPKFGDIAGCMVSEGRVQRDAPIRVLRDNVVVFEGELESLRRFKDDVNEVKSGTECGIGVKGYDDVQPGDQIECFERVQVERKL